MKAGPGNAVRPGFMVYRQRFGTKSFAVLCVFSMSTALQLYEQERADKHAGNSGSDCHHAGGDAQPRPDCASDVRHNNCANSGGGQEDAHGARRHGGADTRHCRRINTRNGEPKQRQQYKCGYGMVCVHESHVANETADRHNGQCAGTAADRQDKRYGKPSNQRCQPDDGDGALAPEGRQDAGILKICDHPAGHTDFCAVLEEDQGCENPEACTAQKTPVPIRLSGYPPGGS